MDKPEIEWAKRLAAGDKSAMQPFVESFQRKVFQYTWLMCGQREDAEEVAQDTLLKVFENFEQLENPEHVKAWVFQIARNCCLMKRRKSVFAPVSEVPLEDVELRDNLDQPEEAFLRKEMTEELERALRTLPETYRAVVMLRDLEELSTAETAALLEISEDNVKQRLHRGRAKLKEALLAA